MRIKSWAFIYLFILYFFILNCLSVSAGYDIASPTDDDQINASSLPACQTCVGNRCVNRADQGIKCDNSQSACLITLTGTDGCSLLIKTDSNIIESTLEIKPDTYSNIIESTLETKPGMIKLDRSCEPTDFNCIFNANIIEDNWQAKPEIFDPNKPTSIWKNLPDTVYYPNYLSVTREDKALNTDTVQSQGICVNGNYQVECASPKSQGNCLIDSGQEHVWQCVNSQWQYQYPQCSTRCSPTSQVSSLCKNKSAGQIINDCIRVDCDTNIGNKYCIRQYCDNQGILSEIPGKEMGSCTQSELNNCKVGTISRSCYKQTCQGGSYVCIDKKWNADCQLIDVTGTRTATQCQYGDPDITGKPNINWTAPKMTNNSVMLGPTATPIPTPIIASCNGICTNVDESCSQLGGNKSNNIGSNNYCALTGGSTSFGSNWCCEIKSTSSTSTIKSYKCIENTVMKYSAEKNDYVVEKECPGGCFEDDRTQIINCLEKPLTSATKSPYDLQLENYQKEIGSTCSQQNTCCAGGNGVCVGTGLFNAGGLKCLACDASAVCWNNSCQDMSRLKSGCDPATTGVMRSAETGGKCFICVRATGNDGLFTKIGYWFAANPKICDEHDKGNKQGLNGLDVLNNLLSPEDQYKARNLSYLNIIASTKDPLEQAKIMGLMFGDNWSQGWATINKFLQQGTATIGDTFGQQWGNRTPAGESSMGSYYQQTLNTKIELEKQGKEYKVDFLTQALPTGFAGVLKPVWNTFNGVLLTVPGAIINKSTGIVVEEKIDEANKAIINQAYGNNEPLKKAAYSAQVVGEDVFNIGTTAISFVPISAVPNLGTYFRLTRNVPKVSSKIQTVAKEIPVVKRIAPGAAKAENTGIRTGQQVVRNPQIKKAVAGVQSANETIAAVPQQIKKAVKAQSTSPKGFSAWEKYILNEPIKIERQVANSIVGKTITDDVIKQALINASKNKYLPNEIDAAISRVRQNAVNIEKAQQQQIALQQQKVASQEKPKIQLKDNSQAVVRPQSGSGYAMPKEYAMSSHGNIVQDYAYSIPGKKAGGIGDGVSGAGPKSVYAAIDGSTGITNSLDKAILSRNSYSEIYNEVNQTAHALNNQIYSKYLTAEGPASSTVISGVVKDNKLFVARIGDTEGRIIRKGSISDLENFVKEAEFGSSNQLLGKNIPVQVGGGRGGLTRDIRMTIHPLQAGDKIVLTSDGIGKVLSEQEIYQIVFSSKSAVEAEKNLVNAAINGSMKKYGKIVDDFSAYIIFN